MGSIARALLAASVLVIASACSSPPPASRAPSTSSPSPSPSASPAPEPCRYAFPVRPADETSYVASHHDYPATDIQAPLGADVVAPTDGVVDHVSRTDRWPGTGDEPALRGGLSVAIVGNDGIRYYGSHLRDVTDGIEPGTRVRAGELIGHVGTTGNAAGTAPHLHFGISHPTAPDDWKVRRGEIGPAPYLDAWKAGDDVTPEVPDAKPATCVRAQ